MREQFTSLLEDDIDLELVLADSSKARAAGVGTISFQREFNTDPHDVFRGCALGKYFSVEGEDYEEAHISPKISVLKRPLRSNKKKG